MVHYQTEFGVLFTFDRTMLKIVMLNNTVVVFDNELEKIIKFLKEYLSKIDK